MQQVQGRAEWLSVSYGRLAFPRAAVNLICRILGGLRSV